MQPTILFRMTVRTRATIRALNTAKAIVLRCETVLVLIFSYCESAGALLSVGEVCQLW